jgi:hypothetical protein
VCVLHHFVYNGRSSFAMYFSILLYPAALNIYCLPIQNVSTQMRVSMCLFHEGAWSKTFFFSLVYNKKGRIFRKKVRWKEMRNIGVLNWLEIFMTHKVITSFQRRPGRHSFSPFPSYTTLWVKRWNCTTAHHQPASNSSLLTQHPIVPLCKQIYEVRNTSRLLLLPPPLGT